MTLAWVRRPTCEARSAAWKASPITYTPPWKYRTTWRGSIPSMVISAVGTPPSAAAVTVTSAGSGCADVSSRSSRRCSLTSLSNWEADCRRMASRFSRCSVLTEVSLRVEFARQHPRRARPCHSAAEISCREAGHSQACRQAGEEASPDHGDSRDRSTAAPIFRGQPCMCWFRPAFAIALIGASKPAGYGGLRRLCTASVARLPFRSPPWALCGDEQTGRLPHLSVGVHCSDRVQLGDGVGRQGQGRAGDVLAQVGDRRG